MLSKELVHTFRENLMSYQCRIVFVADYDATNSFRTSIRMEGLVLFLHILSLTWFRPFCHGFAEECHEFAIAGRQLVWCMISSDLYTDLLFVKREKLLKSFSTASSVAGLLSFFKIWKWISYGVLWTLGIYVRQCNRSSCCRFEVGGLDEGEKLTTPSWLCMNLVAFKR